MMCEPNWTDLAAALTTATLSRLARHGLRGPKPDRLFSRLVVFNEIAVRKDAIDAWIPSRSVTAPQRTWSVADEAIWLEWLDGVVFDLDWWESLDDWCQSPSGLVWRSLLPYFVSRSREVLSRIDPRPGVNVYEATRMTGVASASSAASSSSGPSGGHDADQADH